MATNGIIDMGKIPRLVRSSKTRNNLKSLESHPTDLLHRSRGGGKAGREGLYPVRNGGRSLHSNFVVPPFSSF